MRFYLACRYGLTLLESGQLTFIAELVDWLAKRNYDVTFLMHYLDDLVLNTIWKCLLTVFLNLEYPSIQTDKKGHRRA